MVHEFFDSICAIADHNLAQGRERNKILLVEFVEKQRLLSERSQVVPQFCQFLVGSIGLADAYSRNELTEMGDWIGWALCENVDDAHVVSMHYGRLIGFIESASICSWPGFEIALAQFFCGFYCYARERTAMKDIAEELWKIVVPIFKMVANGQSEIEFYWCQLGGELLCWAGKEAPSLANEISPDIERLALDEVTSREGRAIFHMAMSTSAGRFSSMQPPAWAEKAFREYADILPGNYKIQLLATIFANSLLCDGVELMSEVNKEQSKRYKEAAEIKFTRDAAFRYGAIQPFVVASLKRKDVSLFLEGVSSWYQLKHDGGGVEADGLLVVIPFGETGIFSIVDGHICEQERDSQELLEKMVDVNNRFLGIAKTVAYADNSAVKIPDRVGVPSYGKVADLESVLKECYCPFDFPHSTEPSCQIVLDTECNPVQAIQLAAWGRTWPICASLSKPKPDRRISKVLLWAGGSTMTEQHEIEVVRYLFERAGAVVDVILSESCSAQDFLGKYADESYDVFWVVSHGLYDHWYPQRMSVQIAYDGTEASLEDVWGLAPKTEARRLLFLNICDGARYEERGALPKIGLAAGAASSSQATISHLWPVMGYPATVFGIYLAYFLCAGVGYFDAFQESVRLTRRPVSEIHKDLMDKVGGEFDIFDRLASQDDDFSIIECSGSMAFYQ